MRICHNFVKIPEIVKFKNIFTKIYLNFKNIQKIIKFTDYVAGEICSIGANDEYVSDEQLELYNNYSFFSMSIPSSWICSALAVGVYLFIEQDCEDSRNFVKPLGILNVGILISLAVHILTGIVGYCSHGVNSKYRKFEFQGVMIGKAMTLGNSFAGIIIFSIHGCCVVDILWQDIFIRIFKNRESFRFYEMILRFVICLVVCESFNLIII